MDDMNASSHSSELSVGDVTDQELHGVHERAFPSLPEDILYMITSHLEDTKSLSVLARTSKVLYELFNEQLYERIFLIHKDEHRHQRLWLLARTLMDNDKIAASVRSFVFIWHNITKQDFDLLVLVLPRLINVERIGLVQYVHPRHALTEDEPHIANDYRETEPGKALGNHSYEKLRHLHLISRKKGGTAMKRQELIRLLFLPSVETISTCHRRSALPVTPSSTTAREKDDNSKHLRLNVTRYSTRTLGRIFRAGPAITRLELVQTEKDDECFQTAVSLSKFGRAIKPLAKTLTEFAIVMGPKKSSTVTLFEGEQLDLRDFTSLKILHINSRFIFGGLPAAFNPNSTVSAFGLLPQNLEKLHLDFSHEDLPNHPDFQVAFRLVDVHMLPMAVRNIQEEILTRFHQRRGIGTHRNYPPVLLEEITQEWSPVIRRLCIDAATGCMDTERSSYCLCSRFGLPRCFILDT